MLSLSQVFAAMQYRIGSGSEYMWACFGPDAHNIESSDHDDYGISITYDTKTQVVYVVEMYDYKHDYRPYRLINPDFLQAYRDECSARYLDPGIAWDEVRFIDLEDSDDMLEKMTAIVEGREYDRRVVVPVELDLDTIQVLQEVADEEGIALGDFVNAVVERELSHMILSKKEEAKNAGSS